jgi:adenosylcobinamide-phosphate synthase
MLPVRAAPTAGGVLPAGVPFGAALLSVALDLCCGEPPARLHPVVAMGRYLGLHTVLLKRTRHPAARFTAGFGFVALGAALAGGLAWGVQRGARRLPGPARPLLLACALAPLFSVRALVAAGGVVRGALAAGDLTAARRLLGWHLVSRETAELSASEVAGAAVASLAENLTDSIVAPLLYAAVFGLPGAAVYRFVNTADAVLGYRTPALEHFGKPAALTDDLLNAVPARAAGGLLLFALALTGGDVRAALRALARDARRTPSPNGGVTMALAAGGLGLRLEKRGVYVLNAAGRAPTAADIGRAQRLVGVALGLGLLGWSLALLGGRRAAP